MISQASQQKKRKHQYSQPKQWVKSSAAAHRNRVEVKPCQPEGQYAHELLSDWKDAT